MISRDVTIGWPIATKHFAAKLDALARAAYLAIMKFALHYLSKPGRPGAEPHCFSYVPSDYPSLFQAVEHAKRTATTDLVGAHATKVDDYTGETQAVLTLVEGKWIEGLHL